MTEHAIPMGMGVLAPQADTYDRKVALDDRLNANRVTLLNRSYDDVRKAIG